MLRLLCCALMLFALPGLAPEGRAQRLEVIPRVDRLVVDQADLLTPTEERLLEEKLVAFDDTTSTQILVVTIPSLEGADVAEYALELGRAWGVGQQGKDNGVVILVARDDREVSIQTGYGLEGAIPDVVASRIIRNIITPSFREGQFYRGLSDAADALMLAARGEFEAEAQRSRGEGGRGVDAATLFILLILLFFLISASRGGRGGGRGGRRRYRRRYGGPPVIIWGGGGGFGGGRGGGFGGFGGGGGGGFGGFGGGSFGGGGASGSW